MDAMKRVEKRGPYKSAARAAHLDIIEKCAGKGMLARDIGRGRRYIAIPGRALR